ETAPELAPEPGVSLEAHLEAAEAAALDAEIIHLDTDPAMRSLRDEEAERLERAALQPLPAIKVDFVSSSSSEQDVVIVAEEAPEEEEEEEQEEEEASLKVRHQAKMRRSADTIAHLESGKRVKIPTLSFSEGHERSDDEAAPVDEVMEEVVDQP